MRVRTWLLTCLLTAGVVLAPQAVQAQGTEDGALPDDDNPLPIWHNRPQKGGFFTYAEFVMFQQTNPLQHQPIAYQGFMDSTGEITGHIGQWVGDPACVLDAKDCGGPGTYQPGIKFGIGYRLEDGATITLDWMWLEKAIYSHTANNVPPLDTFGENLWDSFITSPVYNFSNFFAGPPSVVANPVTGTIPPSATYGIWNAADIMTIEFDQRTQQYDMTFRQPIFETDYWRTYGLVGPRFFWIWERFKWTTIKEDINGDYGPLDVAIYNNIVSNRMYGCHIGSGNDWYLGNGFGASLDLEAVLYLDVIKERASWELGARGYPGGSKRTVTQFNVVPEPTASLNLWYYPTPGIQLRLGFDLMAFFNTIAAKDPVSFDVGALDPPWSSCNRLFTGLNAGVAIVF